MIPGKDDCMKVFIQNIASEMTMFLLEDFSLYEHLLHM